MRLYFSPAIDEREWHVWRPIVKLGEYQGQFFFYVDSEDTDQRELIVPPRNLYGKEFLELDYRDPFQLMAFQQKWGPITGLRTTPNVTYDIESSVDVSCIGGISGLGKHHIPTGAQKTVFLYEGYGKADIIAREQYGAKIQTLKDVVHRHWQESRHRSKEHKIVPCHVASIEEVAEAVCHAQIAITAITDCLREDFNDKAWHTRKDLVINSLHYCNAAIQGTVVPVDLIDENDNTGICTIMQYLFICMAKGIMRNETYRNCQNPDCKRLFTPAECNRRSDSKYCSQECQIKAKHLRTYKPKTKKEELSTQRDTAIPNELFLSWSESNFPVRTLRKDTNDILSFYSFIGFGCGDPEHEHFISLYNLDIPNPSAQQCLQ